MFPRRIVLGYSNTLLFNSYVCYMQRCWVLEPMCNYQTKITLKAHFQKRNSIVILNTMDNNMHSLYLFYRYKHNKRTDELVIMAFMVWQKFELFSVIWGNKTCAM